MDNEAGKSVHLICICKITELPVRETETFSVATPSLVPDSLQRYAETLQSTGSSKQQSLVERHEKPGGQETLKEAEACGP